MCGLHSRSGMPRTVPRRGAVDRGTSRTPSRDDGPSPPRAAVLRPQTATTQPSADGHAPRCASPGHRATVTGCAGLHAVPRPPRSHTTQAALTTDPKVSPHLDDHRSARVCEATLARRPGAPAPRATADCADPTRVARRTRPRRAPRRQTVQRPNLAPVASVVAFHDPPSRLEALARLGRGHPVPVARDRDRWPSEFVSNAT